MLTDILDHNTEIIAACSFSPAVELISEVLEPNVSEPEGLQEHLEQLISEACKSQR